jgi:hypothetical protein
MAVNNRFPQWSASLLGHFGLVLAIIADFYRRSSEGGWSIFLGFSAFVLLLTTGIFFIRHPRSFFFKSDVNGAEPAPSMIDRLSAWALVVVTPVLFLMASDKLPGTIDLELGRRLFGAYIFFRGLGWPLLCHHTYSGDDSDSMPTRK